ncbi:MAG: TetR/AcrR family transcriptional regulator C-terminal domain-containing protein [Pseudonocardiales bacterium]|nr:TetR/AcrR family transcriptional regulator C-terminal domain-containing protein [Pseudonocardiales bacterium]MBV9032498.1 TetR/AcrR family transcriptional regulator C-terminal domain-containing protein [Pseudonocardiales bacterium]MBW0011248.1 TetR/AcrR family transcriptional regulator C-terminal domain-containing protein [Pseudonocardiales bacterium]
MNDQPSASRGRGDPTAWVGVDPSEDYTRPTLSRPRIVRAALRLVDEKGLAALTMRALATELEVSPMALYNHVRDKDELVDLMVDLMLGEVDTSATEGDWLVRLRAVVRSYHQALAGHHQLARVFGDRIRIGPNGLMVIERTIGLLLEGGLSPTEASDAFFALFTYASGFQQMGHIARLRDGATREKAGYYPSLPPERIPSITAVSPHLDGPRRPGRFDYGLDLLLAGLQSRLTAAGGAAAAAQ